LELPPAEYEIPPYAAAELGSVGQMRQIASEFFATVHHWMPIVSKGQYFRRLTNPLTVCRADGALLCLSMKLIMWEPSVDCPDPRTTTYHAATHFLHGVDSAGRLTLPALQSAILIAIYEIGHAIYPAAHMSVSACAQYAIAMGLGWKQVNWGANRLPWVEIEERRRVWWAVVILERQVVPGLTLASNVFCSCLTLIF
jgi:hypothetical protein